MTAAYRLQPLDVVDGVPVFVDRHGDRYVANYDQISKDHLTSVDQGQGNPFIGEDLWQDIEANTVDLLATRVPEGSTVLDIGVGTGRLLGRFPRLKRYGIDVSLGYLRRLAESGIEVCLGKIEALPYSDAFFDAVVCTDVLEHVIDLNAGVREIERVLKPGGLLIVRVPYREDLSPYLKPGYPYDLAHVRTFDEHGLTLLFTRICNFDRVEERYDVTLASACLRWPFPRGKGAITAVLGGIVKALPLLRGPVRRLYKPVDITMAFRKR